MAAYKPIPQQKLLQILQSCKQIPKDDRLILRKIIKSGDQTLKAILYDFNNKKLQVKLRKYLQKCKEGKKDQNFGIRQITYAEIGRGSKQGLAQFYCRMASKSLQKSHTLTSPKNHHNVKQLKEHLEQYRSLRTSISHSSLQKPIHTLSNISNKMITSPKESRLDLKSEHNFQINCPKYSVSDNYLKQENTNLFTSSELLKREPTKSSVNSFLAFPPLSTNYNLNTNFGYSSFGTSSINSGVATPSSYSNQNYKQTEFQQLFKKIRQSVGAITNIHSQQPSNEASALYTLKSVLIKYYAQDIYDYIVKNHFSSISSINQKSIYLPYRQFLIQLQNYFNSKGENIQIIKQSDVKIVLLEPFTNQYESVTIKNLGIFINKYCLHKNNNIRNLYILMNCAELDINGNSTGISVQKFKKINSWKGEQIVQLFERLVKKWGENNCITYWQMYRVKQQKQYVNFNSLYTKQ